VFVVDNDASVRNSLKSLIRSVGLQVELFGSAQEFLQSKRPDVPSCLILDIRLPEISGLDFQRKLAEAGIPIPIIFITGAWRHSNTVRAMKAGAVEFLTKPFRDQDLLGCDSPSAGARPGQTPTRGGNCCHPAGALRMAYTS
jgi:FixJ family two-component response regulator